jgi:Mg-chelatase subunit ChlD
VTPGRASVIVTLLLAQPPIQGPTFHGETDLVRLDVLVTRNGRPVSGLTSDAFEVRDNGVTQTILSAAAIEAVYLGIALDVSGSMEGQRLEAVRRAFDVLLSELGPPDRYAAVAFGDQVAPIGDSRDGRQEAADRFARIEAGGSTALIDATYAGVLQGDLGPGPKLLLVMTDGRNNGS